MNIVAFIFSLRMINPFMIYIYYTYMFYEKQLFIYMMLTLFFNSLLLHILGNDKYPAFITLNQGEEWGLIIFILSSNNIPRIASRVCDAIRPMNPTKKDYSSNKTLVTSGVTIPNENIRFLNRKNC